MKMTPSALCLHFKSFAVQLDCHLLSIQLDIQFYLIYYIDATVNSVWPSLLPISCLMEKGRELESHLFQLFTLTSLAVEGHS